MKCKKLPDDILNGIFFKNTTVTICGDVAELRTTSFIQKDNSPIVKIDKDHYRLRNSMIIQEFDHTNNRSQKDSMRKSFRDLRDLINCNVTSENKHCVHWITLTYAENMTDTERLYLDFKKFNMRLKYWVKKNIPSYIYNYIVICEPQARKSWHTHLLLIWNQKIPFIPNETLADIWGHGFVKINKLKGNVDNIGQYLTAYLCDIPLEEAESAFLNADKNNTMENYQLKSIENKAFIKGLRTALYPPHFRFFRCSRGVKRPETKSFPNFKEALAFIELSQANFKRKSGYLLYNETDFNGNKIKKDEFAVMKITYDISSNGKQIEAKRQQDKFLKNVSMWEEERYYTHPVYFPADLGFKTSQDYLCFVSEANEENDFNYLGLPEHILKSFNYNTSKYLYWVSNKAELQADFA